jgi:hypothetical protein
VLNGNTPYSANNGTVVSLAKEGGIQEHELSILATWWEDILSKWPRLSWSDSLLRGGKGRAKQLQVTAKAGRKFLNGIRDPEIRKQLISDELYLLGTVEPGAQPATVKEFFQNEIAVLSAPINEEIELVKKMVARVEKHADQLEKEDGTKRQAPDSKHARQIIALDIFDFWVLRLRRPLKFEQNDDEDLIKFSLAVYAALGQRYPNGTTLERQLRRWWSRYLPSSSDN